VGAVIRIHTSQLTERVEAAIPAEEIRALGITYDALAGVATSVGQSTEAYVLYTQSLAIDRRLADAEPGNTLYQRDLSVSYNKLADLAVAAGQGEEARRLFTQSLTIRQGLADAEPGNTLYQRDLSVSYERLAALAMETKEAIEWLAVAAACRRALHEQETQRIDLAVELAYFLYLLANVDRGRLADIERQIIDLLHPFETVGTINARGVAILRWARK